MTRPPHLLDDAVGLAPLERRARRSRSPRGVVAAVTAAGLALAGGGWLAVQALTGPDRDTPAAVGPSATLAPSAGQPLPTPSASPSPSGPMVGGWYAGASGLGVSEGTFQRWLGQPVTVAGTWADQNARAQTTLPPLSDEYRSWTKALDLAVGGTVLDSGETYAAAAKGAYDARWRAAAKTLATRRGKLAAPTFVRVFHEMNGSWYRNWRVSAANAADYRAAHARYVAILRSAMPSVYISWSPNFRDHSGLPIEQWYPGDDVVDCIAPDYYDDGSMPSGSVAAWNAAADDLDAHGNPLGPEAWRRFALQHGKPLCFPETGLKPSRGSTDHPQWITAFNTWLNAHANSASWRLGEPIPAQAAGTVLYSVYFNVPHDGHEGFTIYGRGANPKSAKAFRGLHWGSPATR